jgi:hypothetical protein
VRGSPDPARELTEGLPSKEIAPMKLFNRKAKRLAIVCGVIAFIVLSLLGLIIKSDLGGKPLVLKVIPVLTESAIGGSIAALFGYGWGVVFPPRTMDMQYSE